MQRWAAAIGLLWLAFFSHPAAGQTDTEFWFVAPEVTALHGDNPVLLRFATFDAPATVTVTQPANPAFPPQVVNIGANAAASINLSQWLLLIENQPFNQVLNKGLRIVSTSPISAYYEVSPSNNFNPEIFVLKGSNALGTQFFTPFQTLMQNNYPSSTAGFDIVATQPNTSVTITPTRDLVGGHPAGVPFTIVLPQAGSTWAGRAASVLGNQHPTGTLISTSAPVAVTISDDSVQGTPFNGTCLDINGDQLVPVSIVGDKYIAVRGYLNTGTDRVYVVATANNTQLTVNGVPITTLNAGQGYEYVLSAPAAYLSASADVYVLHITGFGCEVGGALLPSVECTGSQSVAFVRSTSEFFGLNILVPTSGIGNFVFNGSAAQIAAGAFAPVPGTSGAWSYAQITGTGFVPTLAVSRLSNSTTPFHVGIINGGSTSGCRYGYFSDYASYEHQTSTSFLSTCSGEAFTLQAQTLPGASFEWTGPGGFFAAGNPVQVPAGSPEGMYYVAGSVGVCPIVPDSVEVELLPVPAAPDLTGPGVWCQGLGDWIGTTATADAGGYLWSGPGVAPGSNAGSDELWVVPGAGAAVYGLAVEVGGCTSPMTTLSVSPVPLYTVDLAQGPLAVCLGGTAEVTAPVGAPAGASWTWSWGGGTASAATLNWDAIATGDAGWVVLNGTSDGCAFAPDSIQLDVLIPVSPVLNVPETICTEDPPVLLTANGPGTWSMDCGGCIDPLTGLFDPSGLSEGLITATFTSSPPCPVTETATLGVGVVQDAGFVAPESICLGSEILVLQPEVPGGIWTASCGNCLDEQGVLDLSAAGTGTWELNYALPGWCPSNVSASLLITPNAVSTFSAPAALCIDAPASGLTPATPGGEWSADCGNCVNAGGQFLPAAAGAGEHLVTYTLPGTCGSTTTVPITVQALPEVSLSLSTLGGCAPLVVQPTGSSNAGSGVTGGIYVIPPAGSSPPYWLSSLTPGPIVLEDPGCYLWEAQATTSAGCVGTAQAPSPVCVFPQPDAAFTTDPEVPSLFAPQVLAEAVSDLPGWDRTWILDNTAAAEGTTFSFNALTAAPPPYPLCLRVVSEEGCVSQTCKNISPNEGWVVYAPNAFTPDMDGVNDAWRVEVTGIIDRYDLRVFDRWGREVFATQDPQQYWVGSVQDGAYFAPATVYTWRLEMAGRDVRGGTQVQVLEGHVSLLR